MKEKYGYEYLLRVSRQHKKVAQTGEFRRHPSSAGRHHHASWLYLIRAEKERLRRFNP